MNKILVCTDGSQYSQVACQYAAWLAKAKNASITALYVTDLRLFEMPAVADLSGSMGIQPFEGMVTHLREVESIKAKFIQEQAESVFKEQGLADQMEFVYETGMLVDVVKDRIDPTDVLVLGKRGENAEFDSEHLGSMLERVVRSMQIPCFVGNRKFSEIKEVAIAYDGGDSCRKVIDFITSQDGFQKMRFHVLSCVEGHDEEKASQRLFDVESRFKAQGIDATYQTLNGVVETAIAEYVEENSIDLLMLGAYGHSRIRDFLIGSTTTELLQRCYVPVFCFR
jgi:nucleotide-binding universal stress UspA family protein